ncbi:MAG: twin-arginine translocase TatA/TatE family subunit [Armatimonadetes bacterium]|nr:twin-arginine translocase TatA/TatE family subunit [Armatimonadota bacterium]
MFGSFGTQELILILVLVLVLFGARRIPEIMRGFGEGIREFKSASQKAMDEIDQATKAEPAKPVVKAAAPGPEDSAKVEP